MIVNFYICRHGQTDSNVNDVGTGSLIDIPLNEKGKYQAEELEKKFRFLHGDIYCSPIIRAVQTANIIAGSRDVLIMQNLRKCNFGDAEGLSFRDVFNRYGKDFVCKLWSTSEETADLHFPNGESKREVFELCMLV